MNDVVVGAAVLIDVVTVIGLVVARKKKRQVGRAPDSGEK
jgi:ascorbate-specific PTS system EIIC-type component UlaA